MTATGETLSGSLHSSCPEDTFAHGKVLAAQFPDHLILLEGSMGSGKTLWTKGFAAGLGCEEPVTSPTFAILNEYQTDHGPLFHADLYRVSCLEELVDLGLFEILEARYPCVIEWSERVPALAELPHVSVRLTPGSTPDSFSEREIAWSVFQLETT